MVANKGGKLHERSKNSANEINHISYECSRIAYKIAKTSESVVQEIKNTAELIVRILYNGKEHKYSANQFYATLILLNLFV